MIQNNPATSDAPEDGPPSLEEAPALKETAPGKTTPEETASGLGASAESFLPHLITGKEPICITVARLIDPALEDLGYRLVRIRFFANGNNACLQIMAEHKEEDKSFSVADCTQITRLISPLLDVEDPVSGHYDLEVSSPGLERPLTRPEDFNRFKGQKVKLETTHALSGFSGKRKFSGLAKGAKDAHISLDSDTGPLEIPFATLKSAQLVIDDLHLRSN